MPVVKTLEYDAGLAAEIKRISPRTLLIGRIDLPERCANLCFGGLHRNRLFMAASHSIYALYASGMEAVMGGSKQ